MARTHIVTDLSTGQQVVVPYTAQEEIDADVALAANDTVQQALQAEVTRKAGLSADANVLALLTQAKTSSNAQIDTWLTTNVTTLAQARTVLGALIKFVAVKLV